MVRPQLPSSGLLYKTPTQPAQSSGHAAASLRPGLPPPIISNPPSAHKGMKAGTGAGWASTPWDTRTPELTLGQKHMCPAQPLPHCVHDARSSRATRRHNVVTQVRGQPLSMNRGYGGVDVHASL